MARVLVVDDEKNVRITFQAFLRNEGYEVDVAEDVGVAQQLLGEKVYDVVISDIIMPDMSGVDLLHLIRRTSPGTQVIMMTGGPSVETASEALRYGAFDYLAKPVNKSAVLRSVGNAMRLKVVNDERDRLALAERHHKEELARLVEERAADLCEANRQLQEALDQITTTQAQVIQQERINALGQLASGIAHDFNNILMPILMVPHRLLSNPDLLNQHEEVIRGLEDIKSAALDAREIVRRLREFYRPSEPLEAREVSVKDLVGQAVKLTMPAWSVQAQAEGRNIRIEADRIDLPRIMANESAIREVITNLIINAVHSIPKDGVIQISARREDAWGLITVRDNGVGMTAEVRRRCFEPFFTTKGEHGSGLGLAVCYGIVSRHGGTIRVTSEPGRGSAFEIRLPINERKDANARWPLPVAVPAICPQRILVVDDEEVTRRLLKQCLETDGHAVTLAHDGNEALHQARKGSFDLVMTDRAMPGMNGDEVARAIKAVSPRTSVIMLTGFGDLMNFRLQRPEGVDDIVGKPATPDELRQVIEKVSKKAR